MGKGGEGGVDNHGYQYLEREIDYDIDLPDVVALVVVVVRAICAVKRRERSSTLPSAVSPRVATRERERATDRQTVRREMRE